MSGGSGIFDVRGHGVFLVPGSGEMDSHAGFHYGAGDGRVSGRPQFYTGSAGKDPEEEEYHWEEMRRVYPGIFVRQKVLFEGEILEYRVYEKKEETLTLVKEGSLSWEPDGQKKEGSRFVSLNEIGLCLALKEEGALKEKMRSYVEDSVVMEELFQVM